VSAADTPAGRAPRVVSLVPSATETLVALGVAPIACTRFCDLNGVTTVGGTKRPDVRAIVELAPDLVVVNDEENRWDDDWRGHDYHGGEHGHYFGHDHHDQIVIIH